MNPAKKYHAHIYYDRYDTRWRAKEVRRELQSFNGIKIGRMHDQLIGPHTKPQFAIELPLAQFGKVVPWLIVNRTCLDVLVHPITGDDWDDHTAYPLWLGDAVPLDLDKLNEE